MWDIKIITYHHAPQPTSATAHSSNINPMVALSLFGGSTHLSVIFNLAFRLPFLGSDHKTTTHLISYSMNYT